MKRVIVNPGQIPLETDILNTNRNTMVALGYALAASVGRAPVVEGLSVSPTAPASLSVVVGDGSVTSYGPADQTPYSTAGTDSNAVVKMGIIRTPTTLPMLAPTTPGQSVNYLIQIAYQEQDGDQTVRPYFNSANSALPFMGQGNSGSADATSRIQAAVVSSKMGAPAITGTQATPAADNGAISLYVVTIAYGQTQITANNIVQVANAPFVSGKWIAQANPVLQSNPPVGDNSLNIATTSWVLQNALTNTSVSTAALPNSLAERDGGGNLTATNFYGLASNASHATQADNSNNATNATHASNADYAVNAGNATVATNAIQANNATNATNAQYSGIASTANNALQLGGFNPSTSTLASTVAVRDGAGNLSANYFQGIATSSQLADLGERFHASEPLAFGDVVELGGIHEIQKARGDLAFGVVAKAPGVTMNSHAGNDQTHPYVTWCGRVDVKVNGKVAKFDFLVMSDTMGVAKAVSKRPADAHKIIGQALQAHNGDGIGTVLAAVRASF